MKVIVSFVDTPEKTRDYSELQPGDLFMWDGRIGDALKIKTTSGFVLLEGDEAGLSIPNSCIPDSNEVVKYKQIGRMEVVRDDS